MDIVLEYKEEIVDFAWNNFRGWPGIDLTPLYYWGIFQD